MDDVDPDRWEVEIEALVDELIEHGLLSDDLRVEVESLLERGRYEEAGRTAVNRRSPSDAHAD